MHHYLDIHLLPDPETAPHHLMSHLFSRLHGRLATGSFNQVAVSFPGYALAPLTLGRTLRLIAPPEALESVMVSDWLGPLSEHVRISTAQAVPAGAPAYRLRRRQAKSNPERLRRRQMRRHGLGAEQTRAQIPDTCTEHLKLPFVALASRSTGQKFRLFMELTPSSVGAVTGHFNAYGLSAEATIPWF